MGEVASRLFLSADLIGSTESKQRSESHWLSGLLAFYQQFPHILEEEIDEALVALGGQSTVVECPVPELWKAVGDELLYVVDVTHEKHVWVYVTAWVKSLVRMQTDVFNKVVTSAGERKASAGSLKGGAWLATFPIPDRRVAVPLLQQRYEPDSNPEHINLSLLQDADNEGVDSSRSVRVDYVGPSVDIGFRILKSSSARRFPLSVEVAWAMATVDRLMKEGDRCSIYYEGEVPMKGVWGGRGYPVFWIDTGDHHAAQPNLDRLAKRQVVQDDEIRDLAETLHANDWPCLIHLMDSDSVEFRKNFERLQAEDARLQAHDDGSTDPEAFGLPPNSEEE